MRFNFFFQHDVHRKPQGLIILDEKCQVSRADGANTFEIATESKTYYLTADSQPLMEDWVRVLQNVVQRNALKLLLSREDGVAPTLQVSTVTQIYILGQPNWDFWLWMFHSVEIKQYLWQTLILREINFG